MSDIPMSRASFAALSDAHDHLRRARSAVRSCEPFDSIAMIQLDALSTELNQRIAMLEAIKAVARVNE